MSPSNPDGPRWLIVVQQPHRQLYEILRDRFEAAGVVVILDRRRAERRKGGAARGAERRRGDRRQRRPIAWMYPAEALDVFGLDVARLNFSAGPLPTAEAPAVMVKACPDCGVSVEFQLPRFSHTPDRMETVIVHLTDRSFGVQHYADVRALAATGHTLAEQRVQAQRRTPRR